MRNILGENLVIGDIFVNRFVLSVRSLCFNCYETRKLNRSSILRPMEKMAISLLFKEIIIVFLLIISTIGVMAKSLSSEDFCRLALESGGACTEIEKETVDSCIFYSAITSTVAPTITNITPSKIPQGSTLDLFLFSLNTNFNTSSTVHIDGFSVNQTKVLSPTKMQVNVTVPENATLGHHTVRITTETETIENTCLLEVEAASTAKILSISPTLVEPGFTGLATIYGFNTHFSSSTQVELGAGILSTDVEAISPTQLQVRLDIPEDIDHFVHDVVVTTGDEVAQGNHLLLITSPFNIPTITQVEPHHGQQGTTVTLEITGHQTHFTAETSVVSLGEGLTVKSVQVHSETQLTVTFNIAEEADPGYRDILVLTGIEIATGLDQFHVERCLTPPCSIEPTINLSANQVSEESAIGSVIGHFSTTPNGAYRYQLTEDANGRFKIEQDRLLVADNRLFEGNQQVTIAVEAIDDTQEITLSDTFTLFIQKVNHKPTAIQLSKTTLPAYSTSGTKIGTFFTFDPDADDRHEYRIIRNFEIDDAETGESKKLFQNKGHSLQVAEGDFLAAGEYEIIVRVTDEDGLSIDQSFTLVATAVEEEPIENQPAKEDDNEAPAKNPSILSTDEPEVNTLTTIPITRSETSIETNIDDVVISDNPSPVENNPIPTNLNPVVEDEIATPTTPEDSKPPILIDEQCQPQPHLALHPTQKAITLTLDEDPFSLEFTGGQGETTIIQQANREIVIVESLDFPVLRFYPLEVGETQMKLKDCADHEAIITITVKAPEVIDETCQPQPSLALHPAQKTITLTLNEAAFDLEFTGGQGEITIVQPADREIVMVESLDFPILRLSPLKVGETQIRLKDCAEHEAIITIRVKQPEPTREPLPLQPAQQEFILFKEDPPLTLLFTGECQVHMRQAPYPETITVMETIFPETGGARITLLARQVGEPTQLKLEDDCGHEAVVKLSVEQTALCVEQISTTEDLFLVVDGKPLTQWFPGGLNNRHLIQAPNGDIVNLQAFNFHEAGGAQLTFVPRHPGQTTMTFKAGECHEVNVNMTVFKPNTVAYFCYLDKHSEGLCENPDPEKVLAPNALGLDRFGELVETTTYFSSHPIEAKGHIDMIVTVDETHANQSANLLFMAMTEMGGEQDFLVYDGETWQTWDGQLAQLTPMQFFEQLPYLLKIEDTLPLEKLSGSITLYVGYQLENGVIIFNGQNPLLFKGGNALRVVPKKAIVPSAARFEGWLSTDSGKQGTDLRVTLTEMMTLSMKITVEKAHVGQAASLVLVISQQVDGKEIFFTYEEDSQRWFLWDGDFDHLEIAHRWDQLLDTAYFNDTLFLETLPLETQNGKFTVFVGYQLGHRVVVFNGLEPLKFKFSNTAMKEVDD